MKSKAIVIHPTAVEEVSTDQLVKLSIAFQQVKAELGAALGGADITVCDKVSRSIYDITNHALRSMRGAGRMRGAAQPKQLQGKRMVFKDCVLQAVRGKKTFNIDDIIVGLERDGNAPNTPNIRGYLSTVLGTHKDIFKRVDRGVYTLRASGRKLILKNRPKALPAATA